MAAAESFKRKGTYYKKSFDNSSYDYGISVSRAGNGILPKLSRISTALKSHTK